MKKLKLIGCLIFILLIAIIFLRVKNNNPSESDFTNINNKTENIGEVKNNGGNILEYNGYVYYVNTMKNPENGFSNKICRRKNDGEEEILFDGRTI